MWKVALFAVAVLLGTVQGTVQSKNTAILDLVTGAYIGRTLGVASWNRLLAEVMQGSNTGICGPLCYIEEEKKVLEQGEDFVTGCTVYGCRVRECSQTIV